MPTPSSATRTNSLAFAKTDCHTCAAKQRRCDRNRPRCSTCSGKDIVCGGYPMQLTWSRSKPTWPRADMSSEPTDDPFHLEPLSYQASIHVRDRSSRSRPYKPRKFKFVHEKASGRKLTSPGSHEVRIKQSSARADEIQARNSVQQNNTTIDRSIDQGTPGSPLLEYFGKDVHGKIRHRMRIWTF